VPLPVGRLGSGTAASPCPTHAGAYSQHGTCWSSLVRSRQRRSWSGWHWPALAFCAIESTLTVFGSVWLLGVSQRRLNRQVRLGPALSRSAYAAFLVQGMLLIGLVIALRAIPVPAEAKALIVSFGGVSGSFAFGWLLVSRVPALARIL